MSVLKVKDPTTGEWMSVGSGGGGSITVDSELSDTSENPVQNKVITVEFGAAIQDIFAAMDQLAAAIPTDDHINALIDAKLATLKSAEGVEF